MSVSAHRIKNLPSIDGPIISFSDGSIEFLKWLAFAAMIADHINVYLFDKDFPILFELGRLAMPIFAIVLGYNLARPGIYQNNAYWRVIRRLFLTGIVSVPIILALRDNIGLTDMLPLNIMFMLLVATLFCFLWEGGESRDLILAGLLIGSSGFFVEYYWPGIVLCVSIWAYFRYGNWFTLLSLALPSLGLICLLNGNLWALVAIPIFILASQIVIKFPRFQHVFYYLYPLHLGLIYLIQITAV